MSSARTTSGQRSVAVELHGERAGTRRRLVAEAAKQRAQPLELVGRLGHDLDGRLADLRLQLRRRALRHDPAVVDDPDAVGEDVGLLEVLRREEDRDALLAREAPDLVPERRAALRVEPGRRLVEEEDRRVVDEREREVEPALHAAGVGAHLAVAGAREPDAVEELCDQALALVATDAVEGGLEAQVLDAGQERVERGLLQRGPDRGADLGALLGHVEPGHGRPAAGRREEGGQHVDGRRLAGAVRAEEAVDLARAAPAGRSRRPPRCP